MFGEIKFSPFILALVLAIAVFILTGLFYGGIAFIGEVKVVPAGDVKS